MAFLRALQQSGGWREGANLNILNDKDVLLSSGCICKITEDPAGDPAGCSSSPGGWDRVQE